MQFTYSWTAIWGCWGFCRCQNKRACPLQNNWFSMSEQQHLSISHQSDTSVSHPRDDNGSSVCLTRSYISDTLCRELYCTSVVMTWCRSFSHSAACVACHATTMMHVDITFTKMYCLSCHIQIPMSIVSGEVMQRASHASKLDSYECHAWLWAEPWILP
jgi:hypothetical protein